MDNGMTKKLLYERRYLKKSGACLSTSPNAWVKHVPALPENTYPIDESFQIMLLGIVNSGDYLIKEVLAFACDLARSQH